jgi:hypothetical protein
VQDARAKNLALGCSSATAGQVKPVQIAIAQIQRLIGSSFRKLIEAMRIRRLGSL